MVNFLKKQPQVNSIGSIGKIPTITFGGSEFPIPTIKKKYEILIVGDMHIPVEVLVVFSSVMSFERSLLIRLDRPY